MCGRFNVLPDGKTTALVKQLKAKGRLIFTPDAAPGSLISIIPQHAERNLQAATWWLFLDPITQKPDYRYSSFNSRSDKLNLPRSLAYQPYRESRCIIPASAFCEGLGDKRTYHMIEHDEQAIAFGGVCKQYINRESGEIIYSASIITLPPIAKWANIHPKSIPLMLDYTNPEQTALIDLWLDPDFSAVEAFEELLIPELRQPQRVTPIDRPSKWNPIGASYTIS